VFIYNKDNDILIEDKQIFKDGRVRERNMPLGEKMFPDEDWQEATIRAITEELGSVVNYQPIIVFDKINPHLSIIEESTSDSYPGLNTIYEKHFVSVHVPNLPSYPFESHEAHLTSYWKWVNPYLSTSPIVIKYYQLKDM
jgi:hypothetical protein